MATKSFSDETKKILKQTKDMLSDAPESQVEEKDDIDIEIKDTETEYVYNVIGDLPEDAEYEKEHPEDFW